MHNVNINNLIYKNLLKNIFLENILKMQYSSQKRQFKEIIPPLRFVIEMLELDF